MLQDYSFSHIMKLITKNKEAVTQYNLTFFPVFALTATIVMLIAFLCSFFAFEMQVARYLYFGAFIGSAGLLFVFQIEKRHWVTVAEIYAEFILLYLLALHLSIVTFPKQPASMILVVLSIFPTILINTPLQMIMISNVMYLIHTVLSYWYKGEYLGRVDLVNGLLATSLGVILGYFILEYRLRGLELKRLLIQEKQTDVLTSLNNRWKLFETISDIEANRLDKPSGVMMLDLDNFKQYNDKFGHASGDECLKRVGDLLSKMQNEYQISFYRYGGEEFSAFIWDVSREELRDIALDIHSRVAQLSIPHQKITISLGFVYCDDPEIVNYETWIEYADQALYSVKNSGRNNTAEYIDKNWVEMQPSLRTREEKVNL